MGGYAFMIRFIAEAGKMQGRITGVPARLCPGRKRKQRMHGQFGDTPDF